ncbi:MAG: DUF4214 domain-containing protein [Clostridia bacterium]|nr:DUF4214 domain-containing protein [Clostridia bacterium]
MLKKLISVLLSLTLCMSILSTTVFADDIINYYITVGDTTITSSNLSFNYKNGFVQYNPETNELTLTDVDIVNSSYGAGIYSDHELTIILKGQNHIIGNDNNKITTGIYAEEGDLTIKGDGSLRISYNNDYSSTIYANGIRVPDGKLIINTTNDITISTFQSCLFAKDYIDIYGTGKLDLFSRYGSSIYSYGDVYFSGENVVEINAKKNGIDALYVYLQGNNKINISAKDCGISGDYEIGLSDSGSLTISAKTGIESLWGSIINNSTGYLFISADNNGIAASENITIKGTSEIIIDSDECAIESYVGNVTISGKNSITLKNCTYGLYLEEGKASILDENQISIDCSSGGILARDGIDINNDGIIEIDSDYIGIFVEGDSLNISGKGKLEINSIDDGILLNDGCQLKISDANYVSVDSLESMAVAIRYVENPVSINGTIGQVSFTSSPLFKAITDYDKKDYSISTDTPEVYSITGAPNERSVTYSMKNYTVSFDMGGHGTSINNQAVTHNNSVTKPSDPKATGYKFDGWYTDKNFTKAFDFNTAITSNTTIYAKWTCLHANTEIKNKKDATTTVAGYTGDTYCKDCGELISSGAAIPTLTPAPTAAPTSAPTAAPELNVGDFINRCYSVALGREADEAGYNYWVDNLNNGQACGAQVGYGFIFSQEYINKNRTDKEFVTDMYAMYFGREADTAGFNYWVSLLESGLTREDIMAGFANSEEFYNLCNKYGVVCGTYLVGVPNDVQGGVNCFVARLYKVCLNRLPDMGGQAGWVLKLMNGEVSGTSAAYGFVFSPEFIGKNPSNEAFVNYMYAAFFGREADEAGFNAWVDVLNNGGSYEDVFAGFSGSAEFANLCASYGIQA